MNLETRIIRKVWNFVETANPYSLLNLSDKELIKKLTDEVERVSSLSSHESENLIEYIVTRKLLIRDLAASKID